MTKKFRRDEAEYILISVSWLAPVGRCALDYRDIIFLICLMLFPLLLLFLNNKQVSAISASVLLILVCSVDKDFFFMSVVPVMMLYADRYFLNKEKNQGNSDIFFTGVLILLILQIVFLFIRTPVTLDIVWWSRTISLTYAFLLVIFIPMIVSFIKYKGKKKSQELVSYRKISVLAMGGIIITTYCYFLKYGFYNSEMYMLNLYPWFIFVYSFMKNNGFYRALVFEKTEKLITSFINKK